MTNAADEIFHLFVSRLTSLLAVAPQSEQVIAEHFGLELVQTKKWLERAYAARVVRRLDKSARYELANAR